MVLFACEYFFFRFDLSFVCYSIDFSLCVCAYFLWFVFTSFSHSGPFKIYSRLNDGEFATFCIFYRVFFSPFLAHPHVVYLCM